MVRAQSPRRPRIVAASRLRDSIRAAGPDSGSVLLEAVVAMIVVTVVMAAVTGVLITGSTSTTSQRNAQRAAHLATTAMDTAQALGSASAIASLDAPAAGSVPVTTIAARPAVAALLDTMVMDATSTAARTQTIDDVAYTTAYFVGDCWVPASGTDGDCTRTAGAGALKYLRVVTVVVWPDRGCASGWCDYASTALVNTQPGNAVSERSLFALTAPAAASIDLAALPGPVTIGYVTATGVLAPPLTYSGTVAECGDAPESLVAGGATRSGFVLNPATGGISHVAPTAATVADQIGTFCFVITAVDAALNRATVSFGNWSTTLNCHGVPHTTRWGDASEPYWHAMPANSYIFEAKTGPLCASGAIKYRISIKRYTNFEVGYPDGHPVGQILLCEPYTGSGPLQNGAMGTPPDGPVCENMSGVVVLYNAPPPGNYCVVVDLMTSAGSTIGSYRFVWPFIDSTHAQPPATVPPACRT